MIVENCLSPLPPQICFKKLRTRVPSPPANTIAQTLEWFIKFLMGWYVLLWQETYHFQSQIWMWKIRLLVNPAAHPNVPWLTRQKQKSRVIETSKRAESRHGRSIRALTKIIHASRGKLVAPQSVFDDVMDRLLCRYKCRRLKSRQNSQPKKACSHARGFTGARLRGALFLPNAGMLLGEPEIFPRGGNKIFGSVLDRGMCPKLGA
jgi:hypothetical protein